MNESVDLVKKIIPELHEEYIKDFVRWFDIIFYAYIYTVILSWFGNIEPYLHFSKLFLMVSAFFIGATIGNWLKIEKYI